MFSILPPLETSKYSCWAFSRVVDPDYDFPDLYCNIVGSKDVIIQKNHIVNFQTAVWIPAFFFFLGNQIYYCIVLQLEQFIQFLSFTVHTNNPLIIIIIVSVQA